MPVTEWDGKMYSISLCGWRKKGLGRENMEGNPSYSLPSPSPFSLEAKSIIHFFIGSFVIKVVISSSPSFQSPTTIAKFILITCIACLKAVLTKPDSKPLAIYLTKKSFLNCHNCFWQE